MDIAYIYREGSPYAYILQVNEYLVDENKLEILIDNILITEKGYETKYSDSPVNAGVLYVPKTYEDICENRNAENITYTIEIDDILYKIASGCVALKMHEGYWKIYYYETCGECNVGYVEVINNEKEIETFLRENDTNYDESQLIVNGDFNASDAVSAAGIRKTSDGAG